MKSTLKQIVILLIVIVFLTNCDYEINLHSNQQLLQKNGLTDSTLARLDYYYIKYPDSAIVISNNLLLQHKNTLSVNNQIFLYSNLAEIYQYRKKNDILALQNLTSAIKIFSEHPELPLNNPYFFVNIGNILCKNNLYQQALRTYKEALNINVVPDNPYIKVLINNNIALTYSKLNQLDSAIVYFHSAANNIIDKNNLSLAQNYTYLSSLYVNNNLMDSVPLYYNKAMDILRKYQHNNLHHKPEHYNKFDVFYHEILSNTEMNMASFFAYQMHYDSSLVYLKKSLVNSKLAYLYPEQAEIYFQIGQNGIAINNKKQIEVYADSAIMFAQKIYVYSSLLRFSHFYKAYYAEHNKPYKVKDYSKLIELYQDTILKQKYSDELLAQKINMATSSVDLVIGNMRVVQKEYAYFRKRRCG